MRKFLSLLLAVALMFTCASLVACDSCDEKKVIGTYTLTSMTIDGEEMEIPDGFGSTIEIKKDNKFKMTQTLNGPEEVYEGDWSLDGDTLTLTIEEDGSDPVELTVGENTLTLTLSEDGLSQVSVFTKQ